MTPEHYKRDARQRHALLKAKGLCVYCGKTEAAPGRTACLAKNAANRKHYQRTGRTLTPEQRLLANSYQRAYRARRTHGNPAL